MNGVSIHIKNPDGSTRTIKGNIRIAELEAEVTMRREQAEGLQNQWVKDTQKIVALETEVKMLRKDAERYWWLRGRISGAEYRRIGLLYEEIVGVDRLIDAAIDAAREVK